ncbi:hypothetical protein [Leptospira sp. 'Mane']|uniref:hypothetical protein n=1 Tax=Leptospira sp. 'Mane' TaxID=3387407 RepID=UPI00398A5BB3
MKSETRSPEFTDSLEWGRWFEPKFGDRVERPEGGGKRFYVLFREKQSNRVLRSVTIQLEDKEFKLRPNEYLNYPVSYTAYMAKNFLVVPDYRMIRDVRNQPYPQQPYYYTANAGVLLIIGGVFVLGTAGGFIVGLAKGTYELTDDIWDGFTLSGREVVLDYSDYSYDENGKLVQVSSYLPYRAITKSVIPVYDREGKKEVATFYPSDNPSLLFEIQYKYANRSEVPNSAVYKEFIPKENKKIIQLPLMK